jgi:hypothetical protein
MARSRNGGVRSAQRAPSSPVDRARKCTKPLHFGRLRRRGSVLLTRRPGVRVPGGPPLIHWNGLGFCVFGFWLRDGWGQSGVTGAVPSAPWVHWREHYNRFGPHSALDYRPPAPAAIEIRPPGMSSLPLAVVPSLISGADYHGGRVKRAPGCRAGSPRDDFDWYATLGPEGTRKVCEASDVAARPAPLRPERLRDTPDSAYAPEVAWQTRRRASRCRCRVVWRNAGRLRSCGKGDERRRQPWQSNNFADGVVVFWVA